MQAHSSIEKPIYKNVEKRQTNKAPLNLKWICLSFTGSLKNLQLNALKRKKGWLDELYAVIIFTP